MGTRITKIKRTFKEGWDNFRRNGWLSFATVSVLAISLYIISSTMIIGVASNIVLKNVQDKINVSLYFNSDVPDDKIQEIKSKLIGYQEIKSIDFVSKEKALEQFKKLGNNNPSITQALDEIGDNPLLSALVIKVFRHLGFIPPVVPILRMALLAERFGELLQRQDGAGVFFQSWFGGGGGGKAG